MPVNIQFPIGGLHRGVGFQSQPPFTTPNCRNVRPFDAATGRLRGGSRPGMDKAFADGTSFSEWIDINVLTYLPSTNRTSVGSASFPFTPFSVGHYVLWPTTGNSYQIVSYVARNFVEVEGNASGEALGAGVANTIIIRPPNMLAVVNPLPRSLTTGGTVPSTRPWVFRDEFDAIIPNPGQPGNTYLLSSEWKADGTHPLQLITRNGQAYNQSAAITTAIKTYVPERVHGSPSKITIEVTDDDPDWPWGPTAGFHYWYLHLGIPNDPARLDPFNPVNGIWNALLEHARGSGSVTLYIFRDVNQILARQTFFGIPAGVPLRGLFSFTITQGPPPLRAITLSAEFGGTSRSIGYNVPGSSPPGGAELVGFSCRTLDWPSANRSFANFFIWDYMQSYQIPGPGQISTLLEPTILVSSTNGRVRRTDGGFELKPMGNEPTAGYPNYVYLRKTGALSAVERGGKLWIADSDRLRVRGSGGRIGPDGGTNQNILTHPGVVANWETLAIEARNDVVVITNGSANVTNATYKITAVSSANVILAANAATAGSNNTCDYVIERAPKVLDPMATSTDSLGTLVIWTATAGAVPTGCPLIARFLDRILLGGAALLPHVWYASRLGNPLDFDFSLIGDPARAVAGTSADAGVVGAPLTAFMQATQDYVVQATRSTLWVMRGNPAGGGVLDNLSYSIGCVDKTAWASTPEGDLIFQSHQGLYRLPPGASAFVQPLSRDKLPMELLDFNPDTHIAVMAYEPERHGVFIWITPMNVGPAHVFFYDRRTNSFWPDVFTTGKYVWSAVQFAMAGRGQPVLLMGQQDGYVRKFNPNAFTDDGDVFAAEVMMGPISLGDDVDGMVAEVSAILGETSGDVNWSIHVGDGAEAATISSTFDGGVWPRGLSASSYPRARGGAFSLKITSTNRWSMERIIARLERGGRLRIK